MLYGFSGSPGTGKSLNAIKFIIENDDFLGMPVYYHGIRIMLLDFNVCNSFQGWLYGIYYPANLENKELKNKLFKIEKESRLASIDDFPYLSYLYKRHDPVSLWLVWFKKLASKGRLALFNESLSVLNKQESELTADDIFNLGLSWTEFLDPTLIHELPAGSVILVDEVQNIWPHRSASKTLTDDLEFVTKHRHSANHLVYISQNFKDVDPVITRRIAHFTYYEFFGSDFLYKYEHNNFFDISSKTDLKTVENVKIKRDNKYYGVYLSAISHTQKVKLSPVMVKSIKLFFLCLIALCVLAYVGFNSSIAKPLREHFFGIDSDVELTSPTPSSAKPLSDFESLPVNPIVDSSFLSRFIPRFDVMPSSAPFFDDLTSGAGEYPVLTCFDTGERCSCFTQQLTSYGVSDSACKNIAKNGFFDPFSKKRNNNKSKSSINLNEAF